MNLRMSILICTWLFLSCVLAEAKVMKLSIEEMAEIKGNAGCAPTYYCREHCAATGKTCNSIYGQACTEPGGVCYACENAGSEEACPTVCTTDPNLTCTWDTSFNCGQKYERLCTQSLTCISQGQIPSGNCGTVTQCH